MKRWIIYTFLGMLSVSFCPIESNAAIANAYSYDRGDGNPTMKMSPRKLSKHTAKLRRQSDIDREKQLKAIRQSKQGKKK